MLEGKNGILFVYRSGDIVHWIVEGDIIAYNNTGAIYKKNGEFWKTDWSEKL